MAESTLNQPLETLRNHVARMMGYGDFSATLYSGMSTDRKAEVDAIVQRGIRQFLYPPPLAGERVAHRWSFLRRPAFLAMNAPSEPTDTVTIVAGVGTMSGGTLASWIAGGVVRLDGAGTFYHVASRDSATQFTLEDTSVAASAGTAVAFYDHIQALPDDFGSLDSPMTYEAGTGRTAIQQTSEDMIRRMAQSDSGNVGIPSHFAIRPRSWPSGSATGQRFEIMLWPFPASSYAAQYVYKILADYPTGSTYYPLGGMQHSEAILASCLAIAEEHSAVPATRYRDELWPMRLAASVMHDRMSATANLGYNWDRSDGRWDALPPPRVVTTYTP